MRRLIIIILAFNCLHAIAQQSYQDANKMLRELTQLPEAEKKTKLDAWWNALLTAKQIPLAEKDSVLFLYRGKGTTVKWMGDFNGWGFRKEFPSDGKQLVGTDLWYWKTSFPPDARLDYKILIDGTSWIIDTANPHQQWSGVGGGSPNSELRMPQWKDEPLQIRRPDVAHGTIIQDIILNSRVLGYQTTYSIYLPAGYETMGKLPSIYVTDGYEYLHPKLGNMQTLLDNLIADKKIKPVIAVFIDHREPINRSNNKRMQELAMNKVYLDFFTEELIPEIEAAYPVVSQANSRAILGTAMGGLTATYFAFTKPDVFGMVGIQSPAFWSKPQIYDICQGATTPKMKVSMTSGLINDTSQESRKMRDLLAASSCVYTYKEVNEGHSWGNWRSLIDDILIDLFAY